MVVGTEQWAQQEIQKNMKLYHYPQNNQEFVHKIECTLLYNMMYYPNIYPVHVVHAKILEEDDYTQYIYLQENEEKRRSTTTTQPHTGSASSASSASTSSSSLSSSVPSCSYAQLTALLALAAEKWPPSTSSTTTTTTTTPTTTSSSSSSNNARRKNYYDHEEDAADDDDDEYEQSRRQRRHQQQQQQEEKTEINIVPTLCQLLIQCIIRHCNQYNLDRETEINELFLPFQKVTSDQTTKRAIMSTLPAYMGLTVTILSGGNPIPFYIGYAMSIKAISEQETQLENYHHIAQTTNRMSHIETTNLLHDTDHED
jgi:hypothetical protein